MVNNLVAKKRDDLSRGTTNQFRREGFIPGVVYGKDKDALSISVNSLELLKTLRDEGRNALLSLNLEDGSKVDVMLHDYQKDPTKGDVIHVDFLAVDLTEELDVAVPVRTEGQAIGVKDGGVLQQPEFEINIRVKPTDIPEEIVIDVTELKVGDSLSVADLPVASTYEYLDDPETTLVVISTPDEVVEPADDEEQSIEPELVGAEEDEEEN